MRSDGAKRSERTGSAEPMVTAALDRAVAAALEQKPQIDVPAEFAARVMDRLPAEEPGRARRNRGGVSVARAVGYASAAATTLGLAALAIANPGALEAGKTVAFGLEMLLAAELLGVGLWLGTRGNA